MSIWYALFGRTSKLHEAAKQGDLQECKALLQKTPSAVSSRDKKGWTPLHWAAYTGREKVAELLLDNKADVNARASAGITPLHYAALKDNAEVAALLLARGAQVDPKARTDNGTPLLWAAMWGKVDVAALLLSAGANVNATDDKGMTPLYFARGDGNNALIALLVRHGGRL